ncbi:MAG: hypothetical protein HFG22_12170 [Lachnospiraceae bacterium]|nr:hypothetical protein [Lachnospiraceae bacterium]
MNRKVRRYLAAAAAISCLCQTGMITSMAYSFDVGELEISMDQEASQVLQELGKAENYYEAQSCEHQGKEKVFTYAGFELSTYPSGSKDHIKSVWFLSEDTTTPEGIHIGSTIQEMEKAYGSDHVEEKGSYIYTAEDSVLTFYTKKDLVSGIEYKAIEKSER